MRGSWRRSFDNKENPMTVFIKRLRLVILAAVVAALGALGTCANAQQPTSASGWDTLFANTSSSTVYDGGDQCFSYLASNGVDYWCFGDSILGTNNSSGGLNSGFSMVGDVILIEKNGVFSAATSSYPSIPNNSNGDRYWADGMFEANGYFYVLGLEVDPNSNVIGTRLAKFQIQFDGTLSFVAMINTPNTNNPGTGTGAGDAIYANDALVVGQYVYFYGNANTGNPYVPQEDFVARVPVASIENASAWTYWNGSSWVSGMLNASPILSDGVTSARYIGTSWVLTHKPFGAYGSSVYAEVSNNPYGPWTETLLFNSPSVSGQPTGHNYNTYYAEFHPEMWLSSGKLLFSIASGAATWNDEYANADLAKPQFFECSLTTSSNWDSTASYNFICKTSGQALDNGGSGSYGAKMTQWYQGQGNINQQWQIVSAGGGYYNIISRESGQALDNAGSTTAGSAVTQWGHISGNSNQQWQIVSVGGGYYDIICKKSGMALDNGSSHTAGATMTQYTVMAGNTNQHWQIVPAR
jgi:hypothetical protein